MNGFARPITLVLAAGTLASFSPAPGQYSTELLTMLDPTAGMRTLCGGPHAGATIRAELAMAAAVIGPAEVPTVPLYEGTGKVHLPITTSVPLAQRYFDQGLSFAYGFNHAAAIASFRQAQKFDPDCALCYWGEAFAYGPNINAPMDPATNARAVGLVRYANWLARKGTPMEQALTAAMVKRYSPEATADRAALDAAYSDAMLAAASA